MKTTILSAAVLMCICFKLHAQQPIDKLIASEKSFAATSKEQTTKIAFLSFLDSNCVGYRNGEQVNLFEEYSKRKEDSSKLTWHLICRYIIIRRFRRYNRSVGIQAIIFKRYACCAWTFYNHLEEE
jgi:hypothetical protein